MPYPPEREAKQRGLLNSVNQNNSGSTAVLYTEILCESLFRKKGALL